MNSPSLNKEEKDAIQKTISSIALYIRTLVESKFRNLSVEFRTEINPYDSQNTYILHHNATLSLDGSYRLASTISDYLQTLKMPQCALPYTLDIFLNFKEREVFSKKNEQNKKFKPRKPHYNLNQIILSTEVMQEVKEALAIIKHRKLIYEDWGFRDIDPIAKSVINLYGPPGTGKTMLANAIANEIGSDILSLNYSEIESKYVGDAAKNLMEAFNTARETGAVLFFDEADSFLGKRIENVTQGSDQALNSLRSQMLILLEEFEGVTIFATNLVTNFDRAFESRILKNIKLNLPNQEARVQIIRKMIPKSLPVDEKWTDEKLLSVSAEIEGFSGREIKGTILEMLLTKASNEGKASVFTFDDLKASFLKKKASIDNLRKEEDNRIKKRIIKKLKEKTIEEEMANASKNEEKH